PSCLNHIRVIVDRPHSLKNTVDWGDKHRSICARGDRPLIGRFETPCEKLVEGPPSRRIFVPPLGQAEALIRQRKLKVFRAPRSGCVEERAPGNYKGFEPRIVGFYVLKRVSEVPSAFQFRQRLVGYKKKIGEALVQALVQRRILLWFEQTVRNRMLDESDKAVVLLERLCGIRTRIRIGPFRLLDRPREKM